MCSSPCESCVVLVQCASPRAWGVCACVCAYCATCPSCNTIITDIVSMKLLLLYILHLVKRLIATSRPHKHHDSSLPCEHQCVNTYYSGMILSKARK
ncbi:uncharacterized protein LOC135385209 isoform X2 [Ornithodoros turicata]|uniref:uncharacterized protein LOC135385209 isoform X2 n=1 Tax=Ornithodoros turicata TaxID=34597 RepID=UPI0031397DAD